MPKVLITGINGMLGISIAKKFIFNNWDVSGLLRVESSKKFDHFGNNVKLYFWNEKKPITEMFDVVIHLASKGATYSGDASTVYSTNMLMLEELFKRLVNSPKKVIYTGSCFEYLDGVNLVEGSPIFARSEYALSKINGWFYAQNYCYVNSIDLLSFRPFTIYGPNESSSRLIPSLLAGVKDPTIKIKLTSGHQSRDFIYVEDVSEAYAQASKDSFVSNNQIYNLSTSRELKVSDLVGIVNSVFNIKLNIDFGAESMRKNEYFRLSGNSEKALNAFGWKHKTPLEEGLIKTFDFYKKEKVL